MKDRYANMNYRRCGKSGLLLPEISLGLWQKFGGDMSIEHVRAMCRAAFDLGITHFDLANNYGPPPGSSETNFGEVLRRDFAAHRDEIIISSKAGYRMWPGPYGEWGSRKSLIASCDQSLKRLGVDYVDIFYSHRFDTDTPLEETMGALDTLVRQGKALYVGISSYSRQRTRDAAAILRELGTPALIHQPSYSLLNRWTEEDQLFDQLEEDGMGCISFSPLAQGLLTSKYLDGIPADSRANANASLPKDHLAPETLAAVRSLDKVAKRRGQTLAQMAISWVLRDSRMTSALIGASNVGQLQDCAAASKANAFTVEELAEIDLYAQDAGINLWQASSQA